MTDSILLSLSLPATNSNVLNEEIEEMKQLALTLNYNIQSSIIQNKNSINASTYFGKGKIESVINQCKELNYYTIFINDELNPGHYKRIQKLAGEEIIIIDRTKLILDIFNNHATTVESKKQVELASLEYMMPRLIGMWTHLERQMGGIGTTGGPGEKQIEIDKRLIRKDITKLRKDLKNIEKQRTTQRKSRSNIFKVSLAGYTNAGKSSLLRTLTGYNAYVKDQLFATLDTTTKKVKLNNNVEVLVSDTVGFLRNLPHELIASFRSTLGDIKDSDLIIKLIDITANDINGHIETINETLKFLECHNTKSIIVFNKIDKIKDKSIYERLNHLYNNPIYISSLKKLRINKLEEAIEKHATEMLKVFKVKIPHNKSHILDKVYKMTSLIKREDSYDSINIEFHSTESVYKNILSELK